jgi:putative hemolysin
MPASAWLLVIFGLLGSAFCSGAETGVYCVNRLRVQLAAQRGERRAKRLARILEDDQSAVAAILVWNNVMNYALTAGASVIIGVLLADAGLDVELYTVAIVTPVVFVLCEVTPKNVFQLSADRLMPVASGPLHLMIRVLRALGILPLLRLLSDRAVRLLGHDAGLQRTVDPRRRVGVLLLEALAGRRMSEDHSTLVQRALQLAETKLHTVMVPRSRVVTISAEAGRAEVRELAARTRHSRVPVIDPASRTVIGLAKLDSLLGADDWKVVRDQLRPIPAFRPADTVGSTLLDMQRDGFAMALVTDRGGQMVGLVTLKDLLEELVGELSAW